MDFVLKIKYEESLRRFTVPKTPTGAPDLTFNQLEAKIREYFNVPPTSKLVVTYTDKDGDVITMAEDNELHDACVLQGLNPLRINVTTDFQVPKFGKPLSHKKLLETIEAGLNGDLKAAIQPFFKDGSEALAEITQLLSKFGLETAAKQSEAESSSRKTPPKPETEPVHVPENTGVFHYNVQCDGCGMSPIMGPRFKSMIKDDYDLCVRCFQNLPKSAESEYTRYDRPIQRHHYFPFGARAGRCPALPHRVTPRPHSFRCDSRGGAGDRFDHSLGIPNLWMSKPDGRFVCDATIPDNTEVSPGTAFVKIWRLRNSGKIPWTHGTQLVRVGGDELGTVSAVTLQLPEGGVLPDAEIDVAVDLVAPEKPGRYVSYWRLMTPSSLKFGHRVWAMIQVVPRNESVADVADDTDNESDEGVLVVNDNSVVEPEVVVPEPEQVEAVKDAVSVEDDGLVKIEKEEGVEKAASEVDGFSVVENVAVELEDSLAKLESMGFKDKKLNIELLEKNEYDVQRTLEDLFAAAEWDPLLEELQEMGFHDTEMNRLLLFKNKGRFKHVVKDLVKMSKEA